MNVIAADIAAKGDYTKMKHFTIDADNNITVHPSKKAARETGAGVFATEEQFADLIGPDNKRLVEIWNGLTGVKPVAKFANRKSATERIWKAIQSLGERAAAPIGDTPFDATEAAAELPAAEPEHADAETARHLEDATLQGEIEPVALTDPGASEVGPVANVGAPAPQGAPAEGTATEKTTPAKKTPRAKKAAKPAKEESGPREGSKTAQVVAMLQRKNGATLAEIMEKMGWQKHTVRGFMAGAMKKAGYSVESFKPEGGERTYRINQ
jgi:Protein of unknown function (DUF3489)